MSHSENIQKHTKWARAKQVFLRETKALFMAGAIFGGASTSFIILQKLLHFSFTEWWLVSGAVTLLSFPKIFHRVNRTKGPVVVRAAHAFRGGFLAMQDMFPDLSKVVTKLRAFWRNVNQSS